MKQLEEEETGRIYSLFFDLLFLFIILYFISIVSRFIPRVFLLSRIRERKILFDDGEEQCTLYHCKIVSIKSLEMIIIIIIITVCHDQSWPKIIRSSNRVRFTQSHSLLNQRIFVRWTRFSLFILTEMYSFGWCFYMNLRLSANIHVSYAFLYGLSNVQNSIVKGFLSCFLRVWIWMRAAALDVGQRRVC